MEVTTVVRMMAAVVVAAVTATAAVTVDNVAIRLGLPEGRGLSGVCLYRNGPDKRRRVMYKSVHASARKRAGASGGDHVVAGDLTADRVYEGTFARLEDGDQVARFSCKGGLRFEIATPFVVPDRDLDSMLEVKESMERRFGGSMEQQQAARRSVTAERVSVTLRGLQRPAPSAAVGADRDDAVTTVDVFQLYRKPVNATGGGPWDNGSSKADAATAAYYSALPYARYALRFPVSNLVLADLLPDQMLAVKLRRTVNGRVDNRTDSAFFVYTGGLYPRDTANLTRLLDERVGTAGVAVADDDQKDDDTDTNTATPAAKDDTDTSATSLQIDAKLAHRDSYDIIKNTVKCYADGMVYNGYPCRNSDVCVPLGWLCDNQKDCIEGDDEYSCYTDNTNINGNTNGGGNLYNNNDNWYYNRGSCKKYEFRCRSRRMSVCLPNSWLCDGRVDCDDGWDENDFNCGHTFSVLRPGFGDFNSREDILCKNKNYFKCWQGTGCIALRSVCDGVKDCLDGSDERVCDNWSSHCDHITEYRCLNNYNIYNTRNCIPRQWVCDLQDDCPHGEDETVSSCLGMDHPTFNGLETYHLVCSLMKMEVFDNQISVHPHVPFEMFPTCVH